MLKNKSVSINDVAAHAGVSKSTVSLVLQNNPRITKKTREKVLDAINKVGYVYNRQAAGMRGGKSNLIALIMHDILNPFFAELAYIIQQKSFEKNYTLLLANSNDDPATEQRLITAMQEHHVSGIFISPAIDRTSKNNQYLQETQIPTIQLSRFFNQNNDAFPMIKADNSTAVFGACQYLKAQNCQKIGYLGGIAEAALLQERILGYKQAMNLEETPESIPQNAILGGASRKFGYDHIMDLVKEQGCDGIMCFNDLVALGAHHRLREEGIDIGGAVKIIGFDNIQDCSYVAPTLTTIDFPAEQMASKAVETMLAWIKKQQRPEPCHIIKTSFIERQSA